MQFLQLGVRIVSFLPSATETLYHLGAASQIVGVTHECNFPSGARKKPRVIRPSFDPGRMTGREIDIKIVELMRSGKDIYIVDDAALKKAKPDRSAGSLRGLLALYQGDKPGSQHSGW